MGKVLSIITSPIRNWNIESRAHKVLSKDKPTLAPTYQANMKEAERLLKENPESFTNLLKKDLTLNTHLKDVYVKSYDSIKPVERNPQNDPDRPLPLNRRAVMQSEFGYTEPKTIPLGRCTLRQVLKMLSTYQGNPHEWDTKKEALKYNISEDILRNVIHYFRVYHVHIPDENSKVVFGAPSIPKRNKIESGHK